MARLARLSSIDARTTTGPVRRRVRPRGVPSSLVDRELFYSERPGEAAELIGASLAPSRVVVASPTEFAASMHGVRLRDTGLLHLDLRGPVALDVPQCGAYYAVHMTMSGTSRATVGGRPVELDATRALVTNPYDPLLLEFDGDSPQLIVRIEQPALERHLTRLLGHTLTHALVFEPALELTSDAATRWHGALQIVQTEVLHDGSLLHAGIGIGAMEEFLMSSLLMLQPSTYREWIIRPTVRPGRRTVRHALDYIETHLREPITMTDIAEHSGASVRSVQQGFHDELGVTPMTYLRDRRMERARAELVDAAPADGVTVTSVAEHWGFSHLSSFAGSYRKRWGESPSHTLQH